MDRRIPSEPVRVAGDGLSLRPFTPDDVQAMSRAYADPEIAQWNSSAPPAKSGLPADLEARIATRQDWSDGTHASWVIGGADDALVGSISLHHVEYDMGNGQVGYWVAPWARRQGYGLRALRLALGFAFEAVALRRVELYHAVENVASCALASKAGFRLEGELVESFRYGDGEYHDEHLHAILAREWPARYS